MSRNDLCYHFEVLEGSTNQLDFLTLPVRLGRTEEESFQRVSFGVWKVSEVFLGSVCSLVE